MIIVVDAYNLLRSVPPYKKTITDKERMQFIAQLSAYARRKGHKIVIVFDGGPHEWPFKENRKAVIIVYSGIHETADDYIKEYIEAHRTQDLLLVSSDSELNRWADHLQIPSIDSTSFSHLMQQELSTKQVATHTQDEVIKLHHDNDALDIDALMMEASKTVSQKSEDVAAGPKRHHIKKDELSKAEKALLKKLKKL